MKQIIKKTIVTVSCIGLMFINTNVYATTAKAISETTRVRKEASTDSSIVALISVGEEVNIISEEGEWYKVEHSGNTGYVRKDMLSVEDNISSENTGLANTTESTNVNETETSNTIEESQNNTLNTNNESENEQSENKSETSENLNEEGENSDNKDVENTDIMQVGYTGKITSSLDIKILPLINSSVIGTLDVNTEFTVTDVINKWIYIETENNSGWVLSGKLESGTSEVTSNENQEQAPENAQEENTNNDTDSNTENNNNNENTVAETVTKYVTAETLNVRETAESSSKIIKQLGLNDKVTVLEQIDEKWSKITVDGVTGYVSSKYLSDTKSKVSSRSETKKRSETNTTTSTSNKQETVPEQSTPTENTAPASSNKGTDVVSFAKQYLGSRYVAGGTSPSTGFDCSGFTSYVFKSCGISLSRTSSAQASNGSPVSRGELQAGDLVIFNNSSNSSIGHVGIYIGGNTFIHAANSKKGVITSSLSDSYYSPRFVTGRRVTN